MHFQTHFFALIVALVFANARALTEAQIEDAFKRNPISRCGAGCEYAEIRRSVTYLLNRCKNAACEKDFVLRVVALGSVSFIQEYCVLRDVSHSPRWAVRIQTDLDRSMGRLVLVAVPVGSRTEPEIYQRPYVLGPLIPRHELYLINRFVKKYCGITV